MGLILLCCRLADSKVIGLSYNYVINSIKSPKKSNKNYIDRKLNRPQFLYRNFFVILIKNTYYGLITTPMS